VEEYAKIDKYSRAAKLKKVYAISGEQWIEHKIRRGETLGSIAYKYGTTISKLKKWNGLRSSRIYKGKKLMIYTGSNPNVVAANSSSKSSKKSSKLVKYKIKKGDTIGEIAEKYKVSISSIKKWNRIKSNRIFVGKTLKIYTNVSEKIAKDNIIDGNDIFYTVKKGDTIGKIAIKNKVKIAQVKKWNKLKSNTIYPGQKLKIGTTSVAKLNKKTKTNTSGAKIHVVKKGETLGHIAERYHVRARDIRKWNGIKGSTIRIGQRLTIYPRGSNKLASKG